MLAQQGYLRVLHDNRILRTDEAPRSDCRPLTPDSCLLAVQDRLKATKRNRRRLIEALEAAFHHGKGHCGCGILPQSVAAASRRSPKLKHFTTTWTNPATGFTLRPPTPALFTFNNPLGACPKCRGFGRVIGLDLDKAVPDPSLSIRRGAIKPFQGERGDECQRDLLRCCRERGIDTGTPWEELPDDIREWIYYGDRRPTGVSDLEASEYLWQEGKWYGVKGFFDWLESKAYKMHVRVFLSRYRSYTTCAACRGRRLQPEALCFKVADKTLPDLWTLPVDELLDHFRNQTSKIVNRHSPDKSLDLILTEITSRLRYLCDVGLGYLTLDRPTRTLSGGEIERVNLTTCLGAALSSTLFVLDEPTVGLHARDIDRLVRVMHQLRDKGNTLVVVEHEEAVMRAADNLVDLGPGAGELGGQLVYQGPPPQGTAGSSLPTRKSRGNAARIPLRTDHCSFGTLPWLSREKSIPTPSKRRSPTRSKLKITGATRHNLHKLDIDLPLGLFVCLTGVSGSGKSTLAHDVIHLNLARQLGREVQDEPARIRSLKGAEKINDVLLVDQSPLARTPRSTPAVLLGAFDAIRQLFASTPDAESHGLTPGFFSFNSGHGRCDRCAGNGFEKVEMQFLSDLYVTCPACSGRRYLPSTLEFTCDGLSIADALELTVDQAVRRFGGLLDQAKGKQARLLTLVVNSLEPLIDVGLGYLRLGHPLNTLSGGESQRLKLCQLLAQQKSKSPKTASKGNLLILDEPTTGLHFSDIERLLGVFQRLVDAGHSLLVIEHNVEVIKCADWILDLGPDAGSGGGRLVGNAPPDQIATLDTPTGQVLGSARFQRADAGILPAPPSTSRRPAPLSPSSTIQLRGAREHNLKNLSLDLPQNQFVVVSGLSGSGKSTLAFDIIFAEGQRRFLDSMSVYARQFAEQLEKPDIDKLSGLPPTVAIEQRVSQGGRKSTVATVTEIWNFVRLLFAKLGIRHCPDCDLPVEKQSLAAIEKTILGYAKQGTVTLLAPLIRARKGYHTEVAEWALRNGFSRLLVDRQFKDADGFQRLERFKEHDIDVEVASFQFSDFSKKKGSKSGSSLKTENLNLANSLERALQIGHGTIRMLTPDRKFVLLSTEASCPSCQRSFDELDPRLFSFNSPHGWCPACRGHGLVPKRRRRFDSSRFDSLLAAEIDADRQLDRTDEEELVACPDCDGSRINSEARSVALGKLTPSELGHMSVNKAAGHFSKLTFTGKRDSLIARDIMPEIRQRLAFLQQVGLGYLQLDRSARTLSGGEAQRIRLAAQLGSNLRGVLYVLDEPTIGLHPRDNQSLLRTLSSLRDKGNSLLVVEHDEETISHADHLIDLGPGAGRLGGEVVYEGAPPTKPSAALRHPQSPTCLALTSPLSHPLHGSRRKLPAANSKNGWLKLTGCRSNNLRNIDVRIPLSRLTVLTGISGAGKSSLMHGCLAVATSSTRRSSKLPYKSASGFTSIKHTYEVDQSPIGKTSRSCPATYVKIFDDIRKIFAQLPESRLRGFDASRFSFNNEGGRCPECRGNGRVRIEMDFLPTTWVHCEACQGKRYSPQTLEIEYRDKTIGDVLEMTIDEAAAFFEPHSKVAAALQLLADTGLGYLQLGQPSPTLSGGEAQRLKLVTQLIRGRSPKSRIRATKIPAQNLYLIEEPTVGLHHEDVRRLIDVLHRLVDEGHTVVVIEHHMDLAAEADYLLDLGPDAGDSGGRIVARGTPEQVAKSKTSHTAPFLKAALGL
jgi:excinuclease ABC subunit A